MRDMQQRVRHRLRATVITVLVLAVILVFVCLVLLPARRAQRARFEQHGPTDEHRAALGRAVHRARRERRR
jgi:hypothetical protein